MKSIQISILISFISLTIPFLTFAQETVGNQLIPIADGYSKTSINATIFRKNSISTFKDHQYVAFFNAEAKVTLAKRKLGTSDWEINRTEFTGKVIDAHNGICIMHDGDGYLHMAWDHHNHPLRYSVSVEPESIEMGPKRSMVGELESRVTYPEFYWLADGDLIFLYRNGKSGNGNLVMNHYDYKKKLWQRVQNNLIDGEGERNAYWQMCIDDLGAIHLSWVWRETGDVATNHDLCYAKSSDKGKTWQSSSGESLRIPVNLKNAEYVRRIPQNSNLTNQTSITADERGNPYIATYFKGEKDEVTQFKVVYQINGHWKTSTVSNRKENFELGGRGTRSVPISRPQILVQNQSENRKLYLIYRDEEFNNQVCLATAIVSEDMKWTVEPLEETPMNRWEPSFDTELWRSKQWLHIYHQVVSQGQGTSVEAPPTKVGVLEVTLD